MEKLISRAQVLSDGFTQHGILLLAGNSSDQAYRDDTVLKHVFAILDESNERYVEFDHTLSDFHEQGRRCRKVKAIMRQSFFTRPHAGILPGESLMGFQHSLSLEKQSELKKFFARQDNVLMTVSDGDWNKRLHALLETQLDSSGNPLWLLEVPIINFFKTGNSRKDAVQTAFAYVMK